MHDHFLYIDESGDLGFKFGSPYQKGGSSRYFTIAGMIIPSDKKHLPKRIVKKIYELRGQKSSKEIKGSDLTLEEKLLFAERVVDFKIKSPFIQIFSMTAKKRNVMQHLRADPNLLYNYMTKLLFAGRIPPSGHLYFTPDPRTIKLKSGYELHTYLKGVIWYEYNSKAVLTLKNHCSHNNLNLQFIDIVANIVWSHFERQRSKPFKKISPAIDSLRLYF